MINREWCTSVHRSPRLISEETSGVNFNIWLAGQLKGAPAYKSILRLHVCCWCAGFCNRRLSKAAHACASSKPILGLKAVAVFHWCRSLLTWGTVCVAIRHVGRFCVPVPESPWAKYTGRVLMAVDVAKCTTHKDLRVGNNRAFFYHFFVCILLKPIIIRWLWAKDIFAISVHTPLILTVDLAWQKFKWSTVCNCWI